MLILLMGCRQRRHITAFSGPDTTSFGIRKLLSLIRTVFTQVAIDFERSTAELRCSGHIYRDHVRSMSHGSVEPSAIVD